VIRALLPAVLVCGLVASGCSGDPKDRYCDTVKDHQGELGQVLGDGTNDALIKALPIFEELHDDAPEDLRDEWRTVVNAVTALRDALDDAGVDPATYDRAQPPAGLSQQDKDAIDAAARGLSDETTVAAFEGVQQQARDVCGTPLTV
jgi:hypothetical protein